MTTRTDDDITKLLEQECEIHKKHKEEIRQLFQEREELKTEKKKEQVAEGHTKEKEEILDKIVSEFTEQATPEFYDSIRTVKGKTQLPEEIYKKIFRAVLEKLDLTFEEVGSQKAKDFRNVGGITGFNIELKKTDTTGVMANDTCPSSDFYYIFISTSETKQTNRKPQIFWKNGFELLEGTASWLPWYQWDLNTDKDMVSRGEGKQKHKGKHLSCYARPNYTLNIKSLLLEEPSKVLCCSLCRKPGHNKRHCPAEAEVEVEVEEEEEKANKPPPKKKSKRIPKKLLEEYNNAIDELLETGCREDFIEKFPPRQRQ